MKGLQSTETHEIDRNNDTEMQHRQNNRTFFFLFLTGVVCVGIKTTRTWLASQGPLKNSSWKLPCYGLSQAEDISRHSWFSCWTGVICGDVTPKDKTQSQTPFAKLYKSLCCFIEENIRSIVQSTERCCNNWCVIIF